MEAGKYIDPANPDAPQQITSLIKFASEEMEIFDCVKESNDTFNEQSQAHGSPSPAIVSLHLLLHFGSLLFDTHTVIIFFLINKFFKFSRTPPDGCSGAVIIYFPIYYHLLGQF